MCFNQPFLALSWGQSNTRINISSKGSEYSLRGGKNLSQTADTRHHTNTINTNFERLLHSHTSHPEICRAQPSGELQLVTVLGRGWGGGAAWEKVARGQIKELCAKYSFNNGHIQSCLLFFCISFLTIFRVAQVSKLDAGLISFPFSVFGKTAVHGDHDLGTWGWKDVWLLWVSTATIKSLAMTRYCTNSTIGL